MDFLGFHLYLKPLKDFECLDYIPIFVSAILFIAIVFVLFLLNFILIQRTKEIENYYDRCNSCQTEFRYLIKLTFDSNKKNNFFIDKTTISADIRDSDDRHITRIIITPFSMSSL